MTAQHLQDDIFGRYPIGKRSHESDPPDQWHFDVERLSRDGHGDFQAAGADGEHPDRSCCRRMAVGAEHCLSWLAESFLMYRMADAIAGPAIPDPESLTRTQKEEMIIGILMVFLNEIVVNILAGQFRSRAVQSHRLQFEHHESPGRILCECLIDANPDLPPGRHRAGEEVRLDEFLRDIQSHVDLRVLGSVQRIGGGGQRQSGLWYKL